MSVIKMTDLDLAGKRVFIRADLNVPVKDGKVTSDARIRASLPTIELALKQGAKVMVTSHLGRPTEGEYNEEFSLLPVVNYLKDKLSNPVRLVKDYLAGLKLMLPFFAYGNNVAAKLMTDDDRVGGHIVRHLFVVLALVSLFPGRKAQAVGYD